MIDEALSRTGIDRLSSLLYIAGASAVSVAMALYFFSIDDDASPQSSEAASLDSTNAKIQKMALSSINPSWPQVAVD